MSFSRRLVAAGTPSPTRAMVVSLTNAVNYPIRPARQRRRRGPAAEPTTDEPRADTPAIKWVHDRDAGNLPERECAHFRDGQQRGPTRLRVRSAFWRAGAVAGRAKVQQVPECIASYFPKRQTVSQSPRLVVQR